MRTFADRAERLGRIIRSPMIVMAVAAALLNGHASFDQAFAAGAASFDGVYAGDLSYGTANNPRAKCTTKFPNVHMHVSNGTVSMDWNGKLTGTVSPDGAVLMEATNGVKVSGTISANVFTGTGHGVYCTFPMSFTKQ